MTQGFRVSVTSVHGQASQVGQLSDEVTGISKSLSSGALPDNSLGKIGASTVSKQAQFVSQAQNEVNQAGTNLDSQSSLLHQTAQNYTDTDTSQARVLNGIHPADDTEYSASKEYV
ncbi:MAG TPA: type VII secretion target [Pseudonocardiaceae bacterium]